MVKTLINKIKGGIKKAILVGAAAASIGIGASACTPPGTNVDNYAPVITSAPVAYVDEGESYNYDVDATDADGDSLEYSLTDNHGWLSIDSSTGLLSGTAPSVGVNTNYPIQVNVSDGKTTVHQDYDLTVNDTTPGSIHINGRLQDNETDSDQAGEVRVYIDGVEDSAQRDEDGNFSFNVPYGSNVKIKGMMKDGSTQKSYVRTLNLENVVADESDVKVRCVPYDNASDSYDDGLLDTPAKRTDFKEHVRRTNFLADGINPIPAYEYLKKLPENFQGIEISSDDFTEEEFNEIKNIITSSGYLKAGQINIIRGNAHNREGGWGSIVGDKGYGPQTIIWDGDTNGYVDWFETQLNTLAPEIVDHEVVWHGLTANPGHSNGPSTPELFESIGRYQSPYPSSLTPADIKGEHIGEEGTYNAKELEENILGDSF